MTVTVEREPGGATWRWWKVTCHPTGEGLDGVTWAWRVRRDDSHDPPQWEARTPSGVSLTPPALAGATRDAAKVCPDCACESQIATLVAQSLPGWHVSQQGDPRGWVVRLVTPDGREMGVPA